MKNIQDNVGALINPTCCIEGNASGTLTGKTFVLKDIFDVKGYPTGFGNPGWKDTPNCIRYEYVSIQTSQQWRFSIRQIPLR